MLKPFVNWLLFAVLGAACAHTPLTKRASTGTPEGALLVLADPQTHNVYGAGIKQTSELADLFVRVAQRRPELNLLAPTLFGELVRRGSERHPGLTLVLGDATNIACRGEWDLFNEKLDEARGDSNDMVLFAHGNHDSYLLGTTNSYVPLYAPDLRIDMFEADAPTDESWWPEEEEPGVSWAGACLAPTRRASQPMNKSIWLRNYLDRLGEYGLVVRSTLHQGGYDIDTETEGRDALRVAGRWYPPDRPLQVQQVSRSFIVQSVEYGEEHALIILDTSVCEDARGGVAFADTNAGTHGCLGEEQQEVVEDFVERAKKAHRQVVFAGHFHLAQLGHADRTWLVKLITQLKTTYLSGHTHDAPTIRVDHRDSPSSEPIEEINVGSTTDWPITAQLLTLSRGRVTGAEQLAVERGTMSYAGPGTLARLFSGRSVYEVCRHLPAAQALAGLQSKPEHWASPSEDPACATGPFKENQRKLADAVARISERLKNDEYKQWMLEIAAAASEFDSSQGGVP